jgi:long-subunit fatty acid transport protein
MKTMKTIVLTGVLFFFSLFGVHAQTLADAYRLSSQKISGTARAAAMGNAFGALGGDFTSLSINPAGISLYQSNELVITPTARFNRSEMDLSGTLYSDKKYAHGFNNLGYIGTIHTGLSSESGIVSINLGIGMNQVLDMNQASLGYYDSSPVSFLDGIVSWANAEGLTNAYLQNAIGDIEYRDWPTKLAWETYLIDPVENTDNQYYSILYEDELVDQQMNYSYKGGIKEYLLAAGLNFSHKFYIGGTVGIQDVDITKSMQYTEFLEGDNSFTYFEDNFIKGTGYNLKIGAIYKPFHALRLGFAFHTPTFFQVNDDMRLTMESKLQQTYTHDGLDLYDYQFTSPYKFILSGAVVLGKMAIISIDGEMVDYASMKYTLSHSVDQANLNRDVTNSFRNVFNLRVGGEFRFLQSLSLRAGMEHYPTPFTSGFSLNEASVSDDNTIFSFGLGYRTNGFFADFAFRNSVDTYNLYNPQPHFEDISLENSNKQIVLTAGFRF